MVKKPVEAALEKTWGLLALKPYGLDVSLVFLTVSSLLLGPILFFPVHSISKAVRVALEIFLHGFRPATSLI